MTPCPATGKLPHRSLEDARKQARRLACKANNGPPACYLCKFCNGWHVARGQAARRAGRPGA
jgi:hypothetical protein